MGAVRGVFKKFVRLSGMYRRTKRQKQDSAAVVAKNEAHPGHDAGKVSSQDPALAKEEVAPQNPPDAAEKATNKDPRPETVELGSEPSPCRRSPGTEGYSDTDTDSALLTEKEEELPANAAALPPSPLREHSTDEDD